MYLLYRMVPNMTGGVARVMLAKTRYAEDAARIVAGNVSVIVTRHGRIVYDGRVQSLWELAGTDYRRAADVMRRAEHLHNEQRAARYQADMRRAR